MEKMDWSKLLCSDRLCVSGAHKSCPAGRSDYLKDCDRIIFSSAFRRLGKKTQVHPLALNDHIHTRLTHSIESSSVGRSLGSLVGEQLIKRKLLPNGVTASSLGEIVQAACLAHDIGNPPFGHAGESAIGSFFRQDHAGIALIKNLKSDERQDFECFEGNALGFRVITQTEHNQFDGGMRLTYAVLAAFLKYPWLAIKTERMEKRKFSCFVSERDILNDICSRTGLIKKGDDHWVRHPLSYLVEAADDICYLIVDLEDAREMQILKFSEINEIIGSLAANDRNYKEMIKTDISDRRKMSYLRGRSIGVVIDEVVKVFLSKYDEIMSGTFSGSLTDICSKGIKSALDKAKSAAAEVIFKHARKIELEIGSYTVMNVLLNAFCSAVNERVNATNQTKEKKITFKTQRILDLLGVNKPNPGDDLYVSYMKVIDYIGGMTDNYATHLAHQIGGMGK